MENLNIVYNYNHSVPFFDFLDNFLFKDKRIMAKKAKALSGEESLRLSDNLYRLEFVENGADDEVILFKLKQSSESPPFTKSTFRRRSSSRSSRRQSFDDMKDSCGPKNSVLISEMSKADQISNEMTFPSGEKKENFIHFEDKKQVDKYQNHQEINQSSYHLTNTKAFDDSLSNYALDLVSGLVIKTIGFQLNLFINFFTFPLWFMYCSFMFVTNPLGFVKWILKRTTRKFLNLGGGIVPFLFYKVTGEKSIRKLGIKLAWGLLWSAYVFAVLFGILLSGFVIGGLVMGHIVEEPIKTTEVLNFDYTKSAPVALVPITGCPSHEGDKFEVGNYVVGEPSMRVIPPHRNLKLTVSLTMPESDYNRNLGVFQVRVDSLSANGIVTTSSRYPCMLKFKSQLLRFLGTSIKSLPLLAGFSSESQVLDLEMRHLANEENEPTSCLKVVLEQRAQYKSGAGIPEIYAASMVLETELPLYKMMIWNWRKTLFVWISLVSFMTELVMILLCCRPIILPRGKPRFSSSAAKIGAGKTMPLIKDC
ncbi:hypothetical protein C5167_013215 [Papaver somniferum]|uniref:Seipin-2-like n=1 Tax=Papaver somniferum TaxID=3469 RepID=A0A4Y7J3X9_PAPSO|nr:seipin-2-like [Papaver somniferum]RZC54365.1 hypothetical protein C5167_013215 [Papaver somniferum]